MATSITNSISYEGEKAREILFDPLVAPSAMLSDFTVLPTVTRKIQVPEIAGLTGTARDGASCNTTTVGSVTITDKALEPKPIVHNLDFCADSFLPSYLAADFKTGNMRNDMGGTELLDAIQERANAGLANDIFDILFWGNASAATSVATYLNDHDVSGLFLSWNAGGNQLQASDFGTGTAGTAHTLSATGAWTTGTAASDVLATDEAIDILNNLIDEADLKLISRADKVFHVTYSVYRNLRKSLSGFDTNATNLDISPTDLTNGVPVLNIDGIPIFYHPRWDEVLLANTAIGFRHYAVLTTNANNYIALDTESMGFDTWYSMDDDKIKMRARYEMDVELAHTELYKAYKAV